MEGTQLNLQKDILVPQRNYFNAECQQNIAPFLYLQLSLRGTATFKIIFGIYLDKL